MEDILIGEGDDWPTDYYHGFEKPMAAITAILLDAENWDLSICWPEVFFGWKDAETLKTHCWPSIIAYYCNRQLECNALVYRALTLKGLISRY
jgi:hypothetical protein